MRKRLLIKAKKLLLPLGIVVIALSGLLYLRAQGSVPEVTTIVAQKRTIAKTISASGQTKVKEGFTSRAYVTGTIKKIHFNTGDSVNKDDIVLEFDQASLKAGLDTAYSTYLGAQADLASYDQRIAAAQATVSISNQERDEAWRAYMGDDGESKKQAYKNAEALYQTALSSLQILEDDKQAVKSTAASSYSSYNAALTNYQSGVVKAPASGQLALSDLHAGSYVTAGQKLFSVTSPTNIIFTAEIDEADIGQVKPVLNAVVSLDSYPGEDFPGTVETVDAKVVDLPNGSTAVMAEVSFTTDTILPIVGLNGSVDIEVERSAELLAVTPDAIYEDFGKKYVYVVFGNVVQQKEIQTGFEGDDYTAVVSGLTEGEQVVIDTGGAILKDGQKVRL
ncbi:efflux RND transporter periplasmic adaptor subunit [Patescibacteria group bacterium]|nr:efflux RND transporter periplasmic adaptor subunit [Patescibacteria group bacterium]